MTPSLGKALVGWGVAYMVLLIAAESAPDTLGPLAVAFAWLIATGLIFAVGPEWWANMSKRIEKGSLF